jgi:hypothetical protein
LLAAPSGLRSWLNWFITSVLVDVWRRTGYPGLCGLPRKRSYLGGPNENTARNNTCCVCLLPWKSCLLSCFLDTDLGNLWEVPVEGSHSTKKCWLLTVHIFTGSLSVSFLRLFTTTWLWPYFASFRRKSFKREHSLKLKEGLFWYLNFLNYIFWSIIDNEGCLREDVIDQMSKNIFLEFCVHNCIETSISILFSCSLIQYNSINTTYVISLLFFYTYVCIKINMLCIFVLFILPLMPRLKIFGFLFAYIIHLNGLVLSTKTTL